MATPGPAAYIQLACEGLQLEPGDMLESSQLLRNESTRTSDVGGHYAVGYSRSFEKGALDGG
jgi:hypothetical protein